MRFETSARAQPLIPMVASLAFGLRSATPLATVATPAAAVILTVFSHDCARDPPPKASVAAPAPA